MSPLPHQPEIRRILGDASMEDAIKRIEVEIGVRRSGFRIDRNLNFCVLSLVEYDGSLQVWIHLDLRDYYD